MKKFLLSLVLMAGMATAGTLTCQVPGGPAAGIVAAGGTDTSLFTGGSFDPTTCDFIPVVSQSAFDAAYWAHFPAQIQALKNDANAYVDATALRTSAVANLVDFPVMVWHSDPFLTMLLRIQYGYTWVPNAFQPNIVAGPGISFPGFPVYNPIPPFPAGSIKVSLDLNDYPSNTPVPPPPTPTVDPVGPLAYGNIYYTGPGWTIVKYPSGSTYTDARGTFSLTCVVGVAGIGNSCYWSVIGQILATPKPKPVVKPAVKVAAPNTTVKKP